MDDPNITMKEYIRLEEEKAHRISFDESDDDDYTVIYDENSFSYKIISVDNLKTDSENDNDKVNMHSFPSPEPMASYFDNFFFKDFENELPAIVYNDALTSKLDFLTEPTVSPQYIDEFNLKDKTSLSKCKEEEQNVLYINDLFPFKIIYPDDSKSDKDNDDDKIDIEHSLGDLSIEPLHNVLKMILNGQISFLKQVMIHPCAGDVVDFRTWPGISLETSKMSTMDLDGVTCLTGKFLGLNQKAYILIPLEWILLSLYKAKLY
ncbi:hypothetical protein Tco_0382056 [Tanacetum coccineum]